MASFNNGQIVFVNKTTGTLIPQATELTLYNNNSKLNSQDGSGNVYEIMTNTSTSPLTGSLQLQINNLTATFTPLVTTASISAGLNSRLATNEALDVTQTNSLNTLFSTYTNSTTTQAISGGLQSQINSINVVAGTNVTVNQNGKTWTISSVGGGGGNSWLPTQGTGMSITAPTTASYLFSVSDYISGTQVAAISAGLNSRLSTNEALDVTQTNSLNTLFSTYTNSTTTQAISAGLQSQISGISLTPINNSLNTLYSTYTNTTTVASISAGLNSRLATNEALDVTQTNSINTLFSTYTNSTTTAAISAGLQTQISGINLTPINNSLNTLYSTYANTTTVAAISAGLNSRLATNEALDVTQTNSINTLFSTYTNSTTTAAISAGLQTQINNIISVSGSYLTSSSLTPYTLLTTTSAISAGLNSRLVTNEALDVTQTNSLNTLFSTYANTTTVAAISAGLQSQINLSSTPNSSAGVIQGLLSCDTINSTYTIVHPNVDITYSIPTISLIVPISSSNLFIQGIYNRTNTSFNVVLSEVPSISGYSIGWHLPTTSSNVIGYTQANTNSINTLFSTYANTTTVAAISAGLQSQISGINLTPINNSLNTLYSTYANTTTVAAISAGLQSQISGINLTPINNSLNTLYSTYTNSTTTQAISAGLQSQINGISVKLSVASTRTSSFTISNAVNPCDSTTDSGFTATLPSAIGITGVVYYIKKIDASINKVRVLTTLSQTIDGFSYFDIINQNDVVSVVSNGSNWLVI